MEATMLTVDRLVDQMHGEDPGGARWYMSQLRQNETLLMLECFEDMLSGRLPVAPPSSCGGPAPLSKSSGESMVYRVPPNEFLKVLVEGNTTCLGALHAVLQAIGRGDLQGRAASLCISEVRMCLFACADSTEPADGDCRSASLGHRRIPVAQLRELAGVCLSFSMDTPSADRLTASSHPAPGVYAGGRRGAEDANNRRVLMLEALPAVLGACLTAAAAEEDDDDDDDDDDDEDNESGESDCDYVEGEEPVAERRGDGGEERGAIAAGAAGKKQKGKGKSAGRSEDGPIRSSNSSRAGRSIRTGARNRPRTGNRHGDTREGRLPERGKAILCDVTDALLERPWPLRLALPLLVLFEEMYGLVELLDCPGTRAWIPVREDESGRRAGEESVWTRVRSRLMEVVRTGGLDGADFTGVVRQVCVLCDIDGRWDYEHNTRCFSPPHGEGLSGCDVGSQEKGEGVERLLEAQEGAHDAHAGGTSASLRGSWLFCLRHLYAAVPPEWVSTVELVLEQTLHQMPGVAESLLDAIQDASNSRDRSKAECSGLTGGDTVLSRSKRRRCNSGPPSSPSSSGVRSTTTSIGSDLALLILLLREASPLRACSLPLLPIGVDRGRRAEEGIRHLLLEATRCGFEGLGKTLGSDMGQMPECRDRGVALGGARALLRAVLCSDSGFVGDGGCSKGRGCHGRSSGGSYSGGGISGGDGISSGVVSERASQLLELALRWLEEGDGVNGIGGDSGAINGKEEGGTGVSIQDIASEIMSAMFDAVVEARPRLLKALLSGVFDKNQSGTACAWSYMRAWEALMAQEAELGCRRLKPHSQGVSDALGQLTLLPRERGRRVLESMLPLADVCPTQSSALMNLCRKCSVQGESKGRLLTIHAVTCILAWNARRAKSGRNGGFLEQEGMQEDLVGMFRRAFEGGLQPAARADALHLLATKLTMPAPGVAGRSTNFEGATVAPGTPFNAGELQVAPFQMPSPSSPRIAMGPDPSPVVDLAALRGLREFLAARLFRFFAHKDEVLNADSYTAGGNIGDNSLVGRHSGGGPDGVSRGKGKRKERRRRGGRFLLVPLRLLEEPMASTTGKSLGEENGGGRARGILGNVRGRGVVARDAIGQLLKCCWALVPALEESTEAGSPGDARGRVASGPGKRAEVEAIARAVLGSGRRRSGEGERGGRRSAKHGPGVGTREAEALVAVVEFLQRGGDMETVRLRPSSNQQAPCHLEVDDDVTQPPAPAPPACHPGLVSPLAALGVVVTLAEALVDCLLSGLACPADIPEVPCLRSNLPRCAALEAKASEGLHHGDTSSGGPVERNQEPHLVLWATADVFTLLTAATRAADSISGPAGFHSKHQGGLSDIVVSLPADALALTRGSQLLAMGAEEDSEDDGGGATGNGGGKSGRRAGGGEATGPCALLSASSALLFTREFLAWAATEKGRSPAALVSEGWDGGIGVWFGLIHSVQTLARVLRTTRGSSLGGHREGVSLIGKVPPDNSPSAQAIALAVFQLRVVVGTPSAALAFLHPSTATAKTPLSSNGHSADGCTEAGNNAKGSHDADPFVASPSSPRPPPGKMITGFLEKMSDRWKVALPWGLPGAAAPTRASPRLERRTYRRGGDIAAKSLKAEAEDLFFALRGELLRMERLVLSILLVGPSATPAERAWTMRAALLSARRRRGKEIVDSIGLEGSGSPTLTTAARVCTEAAGEPLRVSPKWEEPPESGSGHARAAPKVNGSTENTVRRKVAGLTVVGSGRVAVAVQEERLSGDNDAGRGGRSGLRGIAGVLEDGEKVERDGLGNLCRLAAEEMREGLENGLSVKLSLVYLDLVELLGSAALQFRRKAQRTSTTSTVSLAEMGTATVPCVTDTNGPPQTSVGACSSQSSYVTNSGDREADDAGGILLSITTCQTVSQHKIFQRLMRGAVRFDGIGASPRLHHPQKSRTAATTLSELQERDQVLSRAVAGLGSSEDGSGKKGMQALPAIAQSPPRSLGRSSRLLVRCVRWIRARQGITRGRAAMAHFEEDGSESSEEVGIGASGNVSGSGNVDGEHPDRYSNRNRKIALPDEQDDDEQSRYSFRPEEVKFASSRECFVAMRAALLEYETALSTASSGGGLDVRGGGTSVDGDLAGVLATVAFGLRELLAPKVMTMATTAHTTKQKAATRKGKESICGSAPAATPVVGAASTVTPAEQRRKHKKSGCTSDDVSAGGASRLAALDIFPETIKLLLMRVLERVCLVGKVATVGASAALAKPSSTAIATVVLVHASSSLPPSSCPSSPPSKRRCQQNVAVANAGKPGDEAGGAPVKAPTKVRTQEGETSTADRGGGGGSWAAEEKLMFAVRTTPLTTRSRLRSSQAKSASSASAFQGKGTKQGSRGAETDTAVTARSELSTGGPNIDMPTVPGIVNPLLAPVLPAVALASGDCLQLMLAARVWAEALRSKTRTGGDDPCRKRASVMLFKIERCELDIGAAAQKARQFLQHFEEGAKDRTAVAETRGAGVGSAKKRSDVGGSSGSPAKTKHDAGAANGCDETLETALRLLVSGADTLAAWRRDYAANKKSKAARRSRGGKKRGHARQGQGAAFADDEEDEVATEGRERSARDRFGGASGKRRKSRGARVRSRHAVIDGWLEEGGEEGAGRDDAFVDLEDFIEA